MLTIIRIYNADKSFYREVYCSGYRHFLAALETINFEDKSLSFEVFNV